MACTKEHGRDALCHAFTTLLLAAHSHSRCLVSVTTVLSERISCAAQVAALQEWRGALWRICHGSLSVRGGPRAETVHPEPLAHAWLHLRKSLDGLAAAAPAAMALPEAAALRDAAGRMDRALGLDAGPPVKTLFVEGGGAPSTPTHCRAVRSGRPARRAGRLHSPAHRPVGGRP